MMMASEFSFDIVSEFDRQELQNAVDQALREIQNRFDLKDSKSEIVVNKADITFNSSDEFKLSNIIAILEEKIAKRGLSPFLLDLEANKPESALGGRARHVVPLKEGIEKDKAKLVTTHIKGLKLKVNASIQGDHIRVTAKSKDDLQAVMAAIKSQMAEWEWPLQFNNFR